MSPDRTAVVEKKLVKGEFERKRAAKEDIAEARRRRDRRSEVNRVLYMSTFYEAAGGLERT